MKRVAITRLLSAADNIERVPIPSTFWSARVASSAFIGRRVSSKGLKERGAMTAQEMLKQFPEMRYVAWDGVDYAIALQVGALHLTLSFLLT